MTGWLLVVVALIVMLVGATAVAWVVRGRPRLGTSADDASYRTLHSVTKAAPLLRGGLTASSASRAAKHLRRLAGADALAITDAGVTLGWAGTSDGWRARSPELAAGTLSDGSVAVISPDRLREVSGQFRGAVVAPLTRDEVVVGAIVAYSVEPTSPAAVRATEELAVFASGQLDLAELDRARAERAEAEVRALRAQISPHFVFNSLTAIASFVRTDPDRARELLLDFADFTRYSFRAHGTFTSLADELQAIEQYLLLERARFGERLQVQLRVDSEVLGVRIPFLCLQPLVENAVQHGLEGRDGPGTVEIQAMDRGAECLLSVTDDGVGNEPDVIRRALAGEPGAHVGMTNVDERLRTAFGDDFGLVVETGPGAGTRVSFRVPKFAETATR